MNFLRSRIFSCGFALLCALANATAHAQPKTSAPPKNVAPKASVSTSKTPAQPVWKPDALPIVALPQVPVEFEFAGTQKDLLGVFQSVARGVTVASAKPVSPNMNTKTQLFSDADLLLMLQDIHFLRAQSFNFLKMEEMQDEARAKAPKTAPAGGSMAGGSMAGGSMAGGSMAGGSMAGGSMEGGSMAGGSMEGGLMQEPMDSMNPKRPKRVDVQEFYAKSFRAQKGSRQLFANNNETTVAVWVFEAPRSWALVTQGPSRAIVVRADGYPRLEAIGRLFRMIASQN